MIEQVNFIENVPNPGQDMVNLIEVNQEIEQRTRTKKNDFPRCVAFTYSICKVRRLKVDNIILNLIHEKKTFVNLCDTYKVENTQGEDT